MNSTARKTALELQTNDRILITGDQHAQAGAGSGDLRPARAPRTPAGDDPNGVLTAVVTGRTQEPTEGRDRKRFTIATDLGDVTGVVATQRFRLAPDDVTDPAEDDAKPDPWAGVTLANLATTFPVLA